MFKAVPKQIKEEVLAKVKAGEKVADLAKQYGISDKTLAEWLQGIVLWQVQG